MLSTKIWKLPVPVPALDAFTTIVQALPTMLKMPPGDVVDVVAVLARPPIIRRAPVRVRTPESTESVPLTKIYDGLFESVGRAE